MTKVDIRDLVADYGNIRYCMGQAYELETNDYEKMLMQIGEKYGIEYNHKEDMDFYSGEDPIDKTYYMECKLLEHISNYIFKIAEKGISKLTCEDCEWCKNGDDEYNYCEFYNDHFEKKDKNNICFRFEGR